MVIKKNGVMCWRLKFGSLACVVLVRYLGPFLLSDEDIE